MFIFRAYVRIFIIVFISVSFIYIYICIYINYVHVLLYKNLLAPLYITLHRCPIFVLRTFNHTTHIRVRYIYNTISPGRKNRVRRGGRVSGVGIHSTRLDSTRFLVDFHRDALLPRSLRIYIYIYIVCVCLRVCVCVARARRIFFLFFFKKIARCLKILEIFPYTPKWLSNCK